MKWMRLRNPASPPSHLSSSFFYLRFLIPSFSSYENHSLKDQHIQSQYSTVPFHFFPFRQTRSQITSQSQQLPVVICVRYLTVPFCAKTSDCVSSHISASEHYTNINSVRESWGMAVSVLLSLCGPHRHHRRLPAVLQLAAARGFGSSGFRRPGDRIG